MPSTTSTTVTNRDISGLLLGQDNARPVCYRPDGPAAAGGAGEQVWRARGVILLIGFFVYVVINLWFRGPRKVTRRARFVLDRPVSAG